VVNTEAHFLPRFDISGSKVWKTGWARSERGRGREKKAGPWGEVRSEGLEVEKREQDG